MNIDTPATSQDMSQALQAGLVGRTIKHNNQHLNGNQFLHILEPGGAKLDELCAKLG